MAITSEATGGGQAVCSSRMEWRSIPLGSLEQHGPHLPCGTDTFQVNELFKRAVQQVPSELPVCVCPTSEYSVVQWASPMASAGIQPLTLEQSFD